MLKNFYKIFLPILTICFLSSNFAYASISDDLKNSYHKLKEKTEEISDFKEETKKITSSGKAKSFYYLIFIIIAFIIFMMIILMIWFASRR